MSSGPNYNITLPPIPLVASSPTVVPTDGSGLSASLPPWDLSGSSDTPTAQTTQTWATFSSDFSGGFSTPEPMKSSPQLQNKSIDLGMIGGSGSNEEHKDENSKLNKTVPAMPTLAPPPSNPNLTGSLLLPPPGKSLGGPRRRGTGDSAQVSTRGSSVSSLGDLHSVKSIQRPPSTSSLDKQPSSASPLTNTQRPRTTSTSSPALGRSPALIKGGVAVPFAVAFQEHCHAIYKGTDHSK